ncbi:MULTISPECIES: DUF6457 domain-containing protein [unclassified Microbacterium]|uniref:DUF6457 domain-containing protein n=1 Tax=unclassified Microbacterium TaxID=2609290 RepID=UPI003465635A
MNEPSRTLPPEALDIWAEALRARFGLTETDVPVAAVLDLARDVASGVMRPAAPLGAFVAGLVAGRAGMDSAAIRDALGDISAMAAGWIESK